MALAGVDSRRKCEAHVAAGLVTVNGQVVTDLGRQVDPSTDRITFRGRPLKVAPFVYYLLHKPKGYTTTAFDPHAEKTVYELLPKSLAARGARDRTQRVFPVGRLDRDSTGLLLFTNDGETANRLTHPRYGAIKWYRVRLDRPLADSDRLKLLRGIRLEEGMAEAREIEILPDAAVRVQMAEGKKREVRRLFAALHYRVTDLCRTEFGPLKLDRIPLGKGRFLTAQEIHLLRRLCEGL